MEQILPNEGPDKRSSIYLKIRRRTVDQKALIPNNLKIQRRQTLHTRIEKPFEEVYNLSPRTRIAKMKAARQGSESRNTTITMASESPSSTSYSKKRFPIDLKAHLRKEILLQVSNLCEKERAHTSKFLWKVTSIKKHLDYNISQFCSKEMLYAPFDNKNIHNSKPVLDRKLTMVANRLKENLFIHNL